MGTKFQSTDLALIADTRLVFLLVQSFSVPAGRGGCSMDESNAAERPPVWVSKRLSQTRHPRPVVMNSRCWQTQVPATGSTLAFFHLEPRLSFLLKKLNFAEPTVQIGLKTGF